ncbi:MAG: class II fructose-bisphosphatase [Candidatus Krumholzibacteriota bacterium]|nr:class II fructose-bisphosphatase [Candidatus Krumholzibacteriota bacterium]
MDRNLALELVRVTEAAALASARFFGKGDPTAADAAAVGAMELAIRGVKITGHIVIGEERLSASSRLCAGDTVGTCEEPEVDVALDPLDCIDSVADGQANAVSAIALGPRGAFRNFAAPRMDKIAVDGEAAEAIDLEASVFDNLVAIAQSKRIYVEDLTVAILDRQRHRGLIEEVRRAGARIELLRSGDLAAAIAAALPGTGVDVLMGIGDTTQGVIAAAALACIGGGFRGRLVPAEGIDARDLPDEYRTVYTERDLVGGDNVMFAATGVSHSDVLDGVRFRPGGAITDSVVFRGKSGTIRYLRTEHFFDKAPDYS